LAINPSPYGVLAPAGFVDVTFPCVLKNSSKHHMSNPPIQTVPTSTDKAKLTVVGLLVVASMAAFYVLGAKDMWVRVLALLGLLAVAIAIFFTSEPGKQFIAYAQDSVREARKVVWPTRKEAGQMTLYVFIFVMIMAVFLFLTDKTLEWVIYHLILGWKS
jgi:preprotein translocase subunit SecE